MFTLDIDPYQVLGVREDATELEIRRARRELIRKFPNEIFPKRAQEINEAYHLLMDKSKREMVDAFLKSKAGCALRVQREFLSEEVRKVLLDYPERPQVFELFKLEKPVQVGRRALIQALLTLTKGIKDR